MCCVLVRIISLFMDNKLFGAGMVLIIMGILTGGFIGLGASASIQRVFGLTAGCILVVMGALCLLICGIRNVY